MFSHVKENDQRHLIYGDNGKGKIIGEFDISISPSKIHNVLLVDGPKHNLLSISQLV